MIIFVFFLSLFYLICYPFIDTWTNILYKNYLLRKLKKKIYSSKYIWFVENKKGNKTLPLFCERTDLITFSKLKDKPIPITTYSKPNQDTIFIKQQKNNVVIYQNKDGKNYKVENIQLISTELLKYGLEYNILKNLLASNIISIKTLKRQLKMFVK